MTRHLLIPVVLAGALWALPTPGFGYAIAPDNPIESRTSSDALPLPPIKYLDSIPWLASSAGYVTTTQAADTSLTSPWRSNQRLSLLGG
jgi:hypothetical protein